MLKAVFRPAELTPLPDKVVIDTPTSYPEIAHLAPVVEVHEELTDIDEYKGPTADDLRREAEMFKSRWAEEKEKMVSSAREEADNIIQDAQKAAFAEVKRQTDEAQVIKQQAQEEAERIISEARSKAYQEESEIRQSIEAERRTALDEGRETGKSDGYNSGKAEVERLIERTQVVLERAQEKRGEILKETEKQIIDLVLLIARKVIKVISENQRNIIITNVIEALRKVKSRGDVIIRVNLADLQLATEHKEDFIRFIEKAKSIQVIEDSSVDPGGCIIETDFGEIDARIASQLAELENKILEISPIKSINNDNVPMPVLRTSNLNAELLASSSLMSAMNAQPETRPPSFAQKERTNEPDETADEEDESADVEEDELSSGVNAALTASAALAALATMATKGKRDSDKKIAQSIENIGKRKSDSNDKKPV